MELEIGAASKSDYAAKAIRRISDNAAYQANVVAIDGLVKTLKYHHIVAWGKWLGFTPETVNKSLIDAEVDNAPADAVQKIDGVWICLEDIKNETNRKRVDDIAMSSANRDH
jgi:hypothetical protein